ncbi:hypothetical protein WCLP8_2230007 [uncultured Gammaproteobacteria bacterium]
MDIEPSLWQGIEEICVREKVTIDRLCAEIDQRRGALGLATALRTFVICYFRRLAEQVPQPASAGFRAGFRDGEPLDLTQLRPRILAALAACDAD